MESMSGIINLITDALEEHDLKPSSIGSTVDDKGRPVLVLDGLIYNHDTGMVTMSKREYEWTGTVTITVDVSGTVWAQDEEEAGELAENILACVEVDSTPDVSSSEGDVETEDYSTSAEGEVSRVREV